MLDSNGTIDGDLRDRILEEGIEKWDIRICEEHGEPVSYVFFPDQVVFQSLCDCVPDRVIAWKAFVSMVEMQSEPVRSKWLSQIFAKKTD